MHGAVLGGAPDPADLVGDGAVVGVESDPGPVRGDPQCLERPRPGRAGAGVDEPGPPCSQIGARDEQIERVVGGPGHAPDESASGERLGLVHAGQRGHPEGRGERGRRRDIGAEQAQHGQFVAVPGFGLGPEHHLLQEAEQVGPAARLGVDPRDAVDVGHHEVVLDAAVEVQAQVLGARPIRQGRHVLARDGVQPRESFLTGDRDDEPVGAVHDGGRPNRGALFGERIAVVPGDTGVG